MRHAEQVRPQNREQGIDIAEKLIVKNALDEIDKVRLETHFDSGHMGTQHTEYVKKIVADVENFIKPRLEEFVKGSERFKQNDPRDEAEAISLDITRKYISKKSNENQQLNPYNIEFARDVIVAVFNKAADQLKNLTEVLKEKHQVKGMQ